MNSSRLLTKSRLFRLRIPTHFLLGTYLFYLHVMRSVLKNGLQRILRTFSPAHVVSHILCLGSLVLGSYIRYDNLHNLGYIDDTVNTQFVWAKSAWEMGLTNFWSSYQGFYDYQPGALLLLYILMAVSATFGGAPEAFVFALKVFNWVTDVGLSLVLMWAAYHYAGGGDAVLLDEKEKLLLDSILQWFVVDRELISLEFLKKVTVRRTIATIDHTRVHKNTEQVWSFVRGSPVLLCLNGFVLVSSLALFFVQRRARLQVVRLLSANGMALAIVLGLCAFLKVEKRVILPLCTIMSAINISVFQEMWKRFLNGSRCSRVAILALVCILAILGAPELSAHARRASEFRRLAIECQQKAEALRKAFPGQTKIVALPGWSRFNSFAPFSMTKVFDPMDKFLDFTFVIWPHYDANLEILTGTRSADGFLAYVADHPTDFVLLSSSEYNKFLVGYFSKLHDLRLKMVQISPFYPDVFVVARDIESPSTVTPPNREYVGAVESNLATK